MCQTERESVECVRERSKRVHGVGGREQDGTREGKTGEGEAAVKREREGERERGVEEEWMPRERERTIGLDIFKKCLEKCMVEQSVYHY